MGEPFKLNNGTLMISAEAPGGLYNAAQLKKIAALCDADAAVAKATEDQRLTLFVKPDKANTVVKELRSVGLGVRHYQDGVHQPVACVGALCPQFKQDALATAMDLTESLRGMNAKAPLKIGINGCGKCCVATHTLDVSVIGEESGYKVSMGGKNSQIPELASFLAEAVPATEIGGMIGRLAKLYVENANLGETFQDVVERIGSTPFVEIFAPYSQDASSASSDPFGASAEAAPAAEDEVEAEVAVEAEPAAEEALLEDDLSDVNLEATVDVSADVAMEAVSEEPSTEENVTDGLENLTPDIDLSATDLDVDISPETDVNLELSEEIGMRDTAVAEASVEENLDMAGMEELEAIADPIEAPVEEMVSADVAIDDIADLDLDAPGAVDVAAENAAAASSEIDPGALDVDLSGAAEAELSTDTDLSIEEEPITAEAGSDLWDPLESTCRHASLSIL